MLGIDETRGHDIKPRSCKIIGSQADVGSNIRIRALRSIYHVRVFHYRTFRQAKLDQKATVVAAADKFEGSIGSLGPTQRLLETTSQTGAPASKRRRARPRVDIHFTPSGVDCTA
jgi:hypothetical protein